MSRIAQRAAELQCDVDLALVLIDVDDVDETGRGLSHNDK
jgi:hypothetical protein